MMSPQQQQAVLAYAKREISEGQVLQAIGIEKNQLPSEAARLLNEAIESKDGDALIYVRFLQSSFQLPPDPKNPEDPLQQYHWLLGQEWHQEHEDIVSYLQERAEQSSVPFLVDAIKRKANLEYLSYDDYGAFYKKCLWALCAIGTENAKVAIEEFVCSADPVLREQAIYRRSKFRGGSF